MGSRKSSFRPHLLLVDDAPRLPNTSQPDSERKGGDEAADFLHLTFFSRDGESDVAQTRRPLALPTAHFAFGEHAILPAARPIFPLAHHPWASRDPTALGVAGAAVVRAIETDPTPLVDRPGRYARQVLAEVGGVAGAAYIARRLAERFAEPCTARRVRDLFRHSGPTVRKLGAGYYALGDAPHPPVEEWVAARIVQLGPQEISQVVEDVLKAYPKGHARAVRAWIAQEPGRLRVRRERVYVVDLLDLGGAAR